MPELSIFMLIYCPTCDSDEVALPDPIGPMCLNCGTGFRWGTMTEMMSRRRSPEELAADKADGRHRLH